MNSARRALGNSSVNSKQYVPKGMTAVEKSKMKAEAPVLSSSARGRAVTPATSAAGSTTIGRPASVSSSHGQGDRPNKVRLLEKGKDETAPTQSTPPLTAEEVNEEKMLVLALAKRVAQLRMERDSAINRREDLQCQYLDLREHTAASRQELHLTHRRKMDEIKKKKQHAEDELERQSKRTAQAGSQFNKKRLEVEGVEAERTHVIGEIGKLGGEISTVEKLIASTHQSIQKATEEGFAVQARIRALDQKKQELMANKAQLEVEMVEKQKLQQESQEVLDSKRGVVDALQAKIAEISKKRKALFGGGPRHQF